MPRPLRIDYPGALHHVTLRAQRHEPRFRCNRCRSSVFRILEDAAIRFETRLLAYAVMDTHLHLVFESPDGRLPRTMQYVGAALTRAINHHHHKHDGHVFKGRYFNRTVEDSAYLAYLLTYVHLNPEEAGVLGKLNDPRWTSHAAYVGTVDRPWLHPQPLLEHFGGRASYQRYLHLVRSGRRAPPDGFEEQVLIRPRCTDSYSLPEPEIPPPTPVADKLAPLVRCAIGPGGAGPARGRDCGSRDVAIWWMVRKGAVQAEIGKALGIAEATVSRAVTRGARLQKELRHRGLVARLDRAWRAMEGARAAA